MLRLHVCTCLNLWKRVRTTVECRLWWQHGRLLEVCAVPKPKADEREQDYWTHTLVYERFLLTDKQNSGDVHWYQSTETLHIIDCLCLMGPSIPMFIYIHPTIHYTCKYEWKGLHKQDFKKKPYSCLFSLLRTAVNDIHDVLTPEKWLIDFEAAARNAVKENFSKTANR